MKPINSNSPIIVYLVFTLSLINSIAAICCGCGYGQYNDGTDCDAFSCCSYGPCNVFCCNCDDVCRSKQASGQLLSSRLGSSNRESEEDSAALCMNKIAAADENQDGLISFLEWAQTRDGFAHLGLKKLTGKWNQSDWEDKGYLTLNEAIDRKASSDSVSGSPHKQHQKKNTDQKLAT